MSNNKKEGTSCVMYPLNYWSLCLYRLLPDERVEVVVSVLREELEEVEAERAEELLLRLTDELALTEDEPEVIAAFDALLAF